MLALTSVTVVVLWFGHTMDGVDDEETGVASECSIRERQLHSAVGDGSIRLRCAAPAGTGLQLWNDRDHLSRLPRALLQLLGVPQSQVADWEHAPLERMF